LNPRVMEMDLILLVVGSAIKARRGERMCPEMPEVRWMQRVRRGMFESCRPEEVNR
jgi:hypothetical protein